MMDRLQHRGPDGRGLYLDSTGDLLFGHCRLAIMDPQGGAQPLYNEDRSAALITNGEIYNFRTLRARLATTHGFNTQSDSEVILHLFEEQGPAAVAALDGMFAFALQLGQSVYLARDPIGIKPLYYGSAPVGGDGYAYYFASEQKALACVVDQIYEFPPGAYYDSAHGFVQYYTVPDQTPQPMAMAQRLDKVRSTLETAVVKRLMSDVPLGAFLSGGLDSSLIAAIARRHVEQLHTFSVGIEGAPDIRAARVVADHIGSTHHEYLYTPAEVMACLPEIIYYLESYDQDLVRSAIPCYFCALLAAEYVKVILTGEGADELFAGYGYYKTYTDPERLHQELRRSVTSLHNINLQRVDRLTMCHGIEGRVPFLDTTMIELAQTIPPDLKLRQTPAGRCIEKWILRKAGEDLLPAEIVWRDKSQFDEGSGTVDLLAGVMQSASAGLDIAEYQARYPQAMLRSAEECYYHQLFVAAYDCPEPLLNNVARWSAVRTA
jgi:asparagine synthase (glutamine-hydrolysing)